MSGKAGAAVDLDWDDIQGNVLRGYGFAYAHHLVLSVVDGDAARRLLRRLISAVTPCTPWVTRPEVTLNVAFTHRGLAALGVASEDLDSFPADFREGMRRRAVTNLGDVGADDPDNWETEGVQHPAAHVLFLIGSDSADACDQRRSELVADVLDHGFTVVANQPAAHLTASDEVAGSWQKIEHFGFADGVSQPPIEGARGPTVVEGHGTPLEDGRWAPVKPGEFVLGYPDEEGDLPPAPTPSQLSHNGTYLVYRKLAQDVAGFRRLIAERARLHGVDESLLAAKMVGRNPDGSPLSSRAEARPVTPEDERWWDNDFRFADDERGAVCPVGSHVRRANPRDALATSPELVSRHRLLRRGVPYGPPLAADAVEDDGADRGLLFLAYCASIRRQFEFVQREWLNDGNVFGAGHTTDPISGHGTGGRRFALELDGPLVLSGLPQLVQVRGGDYLFQPSLTGLRYLAGAGG